MIALNPRYVFLCFGLNDSSIGYWTTAEEYTTELVQVVQSVQKALPEAIVTVSSILVARDPAFQKASAWRQIPEWNIAISEACAANDIPFADNTSCARTTQIFGRPMASTSSGSVSALGKEPDD